MQYNASLYASNLYKCDLENSFVNNSDQRSRKSKAAKRSAPLRKPTREAILDYSAQVFLEVGYAVFSLRRVASACGMSLGNLQYYFPTYDDLLGATVKKLNDAVLDGMRASLEIPTVEPGDSLRNVLLYLLDNVRVSANVKSTFEGWAVAQRNAGAQKIMRVGYAVYREIFVQAIQPLNPALHREELLARAMLIGAQVDGLLLNTFDRGKEIVDWEILKSICIESARNISCQKGRGTARRAKARRRRAPVLPSEI